MARLSGLFEYDGSGMVEAAKGIRERKKSSQLGRLLGEAYQAPEQQRGGLLAQMMQVDAEGGLAAAKVLDPRLSASADPGSLREFREMTKGMPEADILRARRLHLNLDPKPSSAAINYKIIKINGQDTIVALDPRDQGAQTVGGGASWGSYGNPPPSPQPDIPQQPPAQGQPQQPPAGAGLGQPGYGAAPQGAFDPRAFVADISGAISPFGGRITSTTGGRHNPGSNHPGGGAVDVGMGQESPEQQARIKAALEARGLRVTDERQRPPGQAEWSGPHLHVEPGPQYAQGPQQGGQNPGAPNPFQSRPQEEQNYLDERAKQQAQIEALSPRGRIEARNAGQTEAAKQGVTIGNMPRVGELEATNAGAKEEATIAARQRAEREGKRATAALDSTETLTLLDGAEELLKRASGGSIEAMRDRVLGVINKTTEGGRAAAGLDIISAKLVGKVPRFEGPQGVLDVQLYLKAAGDLANTQIPIGRRQAALQTMRQLERKAQQQRAQQGRNGGGQRKAVRTGTQNGRKVVQYSDGSVEYAN